MGLAERSRRVLIRLSRSASTRLPRTRALLAGAAAGLFGLAILALPSGALRALAATSDGVELVSVALDGTAAGGAGADVADDGRLIAFQSSSSRLVPGDTNGASDVFVRDRRSRETTRVSVTSTGAQTAPAFPAFGADSTSPRISGDGSTVVFRSRANNLFPWRERCSPWCPGELADHFYAHDLPTGVTRMVDTAADGTPANDGAVPQGSELVISRNGRFVAFGSNATNLVPSPATSGPQVYVKDLLTGAIERISVRSDGQAFSGASLGAPLATSDDGNVVVFVSNLPLDDSKTLFYRDRSSATTHGIGHCCTNIRFDSLSHDGRYLGGVDSIPGAPFYWDLQNVTAGGATLFPNRPRVYAPPLADTVGARFFFASPDDAAGDGLGGGIFSLGRADGRVTRLTATSASYFELDAAAPDGNRFAGTTSSPLVAEDTNETADVYVADLQPADATAPALICAQPDALWHGANVTLACTASDPGSGLANPDDASFTLATSVSDGSEDADASTGSRQVCDHAGNCATAGPASGIKVDRKPPEIILAGRTPANENGWNNDDVTLEWGCTDTGSGPVAASVTQTLSTEAANQSATGTCEDRVSNTATDTQDAISIDKTAPAVGTPEFSTNPKAVNQSTLVTVSASDGLSGLAGGEFFITTDPGQGQAVPMSLSGGTLSATIGTALPPDVYQVCVRGQDRAGNWSAPSCAFLAVYDPTGGFVTGGGWINSPLGAYPADPLLSGRADFGFVSKYKPGANAPTGSTEFQFRIGNLNFHSERYDWLVVSGSRAQYKGTGTINSAGEYGFLLTAVDGQGSGGVDRFRIKIWDRANGNALVYDNQVGDSDGADPTALGGGSIVIHRT